MTAETYALMSESQIEQFYTYGFMQYESGQWGEATDTFRVLCTCRPLEGRFWFGLGAALQEAGSYVDALHAWAMTSLLQERDPFPHFHAAECYLSVDSPAEAAKALSEAMLRIAEIEHPLREKISLLKERWGMVLADRSGTGKGAL